MLEELFANIRMALAALSQEDFSLMDLVDLIENILTGFEF